MSDSYECFDCQKVFGAVSEEKCPSCGGANGQYVSAERLERAMASGAYFNIDLKTGKRAKKRK